MAPFSLNRLCGREGELLKVKSDITQVKSLYNSLPSVCVFQTTIVDEAIALCIDLLLFFHS